MGRLEWPWCFCPEATVGRCDEEKQNSEVETVPPCVAVGRSWPCLLLGSREIGALLIFGF